ncbi:MAG: hypothetical protein WHT08_15700 [Bryobacteraceae bacterium]
MKGRKGEGKAAGQAVDRLVTWESGDGECRIVCPAGVLESIRRECAMAARGPVPLGSGGALLGEYSGGTYRLRSWHPIPCRHQRGPSFLLTKDEVAGLRDFLNRLPELTGRSEDQLLGWFVAHPHAGAVLRDDEISLHQRFFRANDLFLLMEILADGTAEVTVHRGAMPLGPKWRIVPAPGARAAAAAGETPRGEERKAAARRSEDRKKEARPAGPLVPALVVLVMAVALAGWLQFRQKEPAAPPSPSQPMMTLSLRVDRQAQGFLIRWNPLEPSLANAARARMRITDRGQVTERQLDAAEIRSGFLVYASASPVLEVEMEVGLSGGRTVRERVIYGQ